MNNEKYNQIINEAYDNYYNYMTTNFMETRWCKVEISPDGKSITGRMCNRDEFIIESKTQPEFSEKWGLKIEERELSLGERKRIYEMEYTNDIEVENNHWLESKLKTRNIPTKLITITYNDIKTEIYE